MGPGISCNLTSVNNTVCFTKTFEEEECDQIILYNNEELNTSYILQMDVETHQ